MQGYKLIYNGAIEGLEDMGRDLIAKKGKELLVIQCKNWSNNKIIHEKHIFQLYGTMVLKKLEEPDKQIKGIFICTNSLSDTAKAVAKQLNINVMENYEYNRDYPCIKCNISRKDGTKIYHLPFDQQYDRIDVESDKGVDLSVEHKVRNIPTLIFLDDDNKVIGRASGSNAYKEIEKYI